MMVRIYHWLYSPFQFWQFEERRCANESHTIFLLVACPSYKEEKAILICPVPKVKSKEGGSRKKVEAAQPPMIKGMWDWVRKVPTHTCLENENSHTTTPLIHPFLCYVLNNNVCQFIYFDVVRKNTLKSVLVQSLIGWSCNQNSESVHISR